MYLNFKKRNIHSRSSERPPEEPKSNFRISRVSHSNAPTECRSSKTLQNMTCPLSTSSRFNSILDATTYANVKSPGFTSRLVQHAISRQSSSEISLGKYHGKYSSVGLLPSPPMKHQSSTLPLSSSSNLRKSGKTPVRIRIAPPSLSSKDQRSKVAVGCQPSSCGPVDAKASSLENSQSKPEIFPESSRKRNFSDCVGSGPEDLCKKRLKKGEISFPNPNSAVYNYRHVRALSVPTCPAPQTECLPQVKRAYERGSPDEEKRQRRRTCTVNNAILSSLSSSRTLLEKLTSQKRKSSLDSSYAGSPGVVPHEKTSKENKVLNIAKGVQCNLDKMKIHEVRFESKPHPSQDEIVSEIEKKYKTIRSPEDQKVCISNFWSAPKSESLDFSTKLFRKEVSSPFHIIHTKERKINFWAQPPAADELTSSLLKDDCNLDRSERFQSLLACVGGKDVKERKVDGGETITHTSKINASPLLGSSSTSSVTSLSNGLTVTVSSTSTIMTCSSITSAETGSRTGVAVPSDGSTVSLASSITLSSSMSVNHCTQPSLLTVQSPVTTSTTPAVMVSVSPALIDPVLSSSSFSPRVSTVVSSEEAKNDKNNVLCSSTNMHQIASPFQSSNAVPTTVSALLFSSSPSLQNVEPSSCDTPSIGDSVVTSVAAYKQNSLPMSGSSGLVRKPTPTSALPITFAPLNHLNSESCVANVPMSTARVGLENGTVKLNAQSKSDARPALQFAPVQAAVTTATFQFGGDGLSVAKTVHRFGSNSEVCPKSVPQTGLSVVSDTRSHSGKSSPEASKSAVQFVGNFKETCKPSFSFGSGSSEASKSKLAFGTGTCAQSTKPAFQFSSSPADSPKPSSQLGSNLSLAPNTTFLLDHKSSAGSKSSTLFKNCTPFQFGSRTCNNSKPSLSFGSPPEQPALLFGSGLSKPTFQFVSKSDEKAQGTSLPQSTQVLPTSISEGFLFGSSNQTGALDGNVQGTLSFRTPASCVTSTSATPAFGSSLTALPFSNSSLCVGSSTGTTVFGPTTSVSNVFSFGPNSTSSALQSVKESAATPSQPFSNANSAQVPFVFNQTHENLTSVQIGGTTFTPYASAPTTQSSGFFNIGSGSTTRRIREIRRRR